MAGALQKDRLAAFSEAAVNGPFFWKMFFIKDNKKTEKGFYTAHLL